MPGVYLAGPTVFDRDPEAHFAVMRRICRRHGLTGIAPLDGQFGLEGAPPGRPLATRIVQADIAAMRRADGALFCLDGFRRGPEMDPGTAFEIGYMHALGKKMAGWTRDPRHYPARVADFFAATFGLKLTAGDVGDGIARSGQLRDPDGILVHSEGCVQNAMAHVAIELGGGGVYADPDWTVAFEAAARDLAARFTG